MAPRGPRCRAAHTRVCVSTCPWCLARLCVCTRVAAHTRDHQAGRPFPKHRVPGCCPPPAPSCPHLLRPRPTQPSGAGNEPACRAAGLPEQSQQEPLIYLRILFTRSKKMRGWAQPHPAGLHRAGPGDRGEVGLAQGPLCRGEGGGRERTCSLLRNEMISGKC